MRVALSAINADTVSIGGHIRPLRRPLNGLGEHVAGSIRSRHRMPFMPVPELEYTGAVDTFERMDPSFRTR